jgi:hydroxymethylpyrimidine pyrophosphatase-like HAD family hydrolase
MKKKVVFLDIDGTLTTFDGNLPASALRALERAAANGHQLVLCSGRTITQIYPKLLQTGYFSGMVCGAGAEVRVGDEIVAQHFVDRTEQVRLIDYLESVNAYYFLQCTSGIYAPRYVLENMEKFFPPSIQDPAKREELFGRTTTVEEPRGLEDVNKFAFYRANASIDEIRAFCGDYYDVTESSFRVTEYVDGEVIV